MGRARAVKLAAATIVILTIVAIVLVRTNRLTEKDRSYLSLKDIKKASWNNRVNLDDLEQSFRHALKETSSPFSHDKADEVEEGDDNARSHEGEEKNLQQQEDEDVDQINDALNAHQEDESAAQEDLVQVDDAILEDHFGDFHSRTDAGELDYSEEFHPGVWENEEQDGDSSLEKRERKRKWLHYLKRVEMRSFQKCLPYLGSPDNIYCYTVYPDVLAEWTGRCPSDTFDAQDSLRMCSSEIMTQASRNRIFRMKSILKEWPGYLSIAFYSPPDRVDGDMEALLGSLFPQSFSDNVKLSCKESEREPQYNLRSPPYASDYASRLKVHLVVPEKVSLTGEGYPINYLRSLAFSEGFKQAKYTAIYDIDFIPSAGLCSKLTRWIDSARVDEFSPTPRQKRDPHINMIFRRPLISATDNVSVAVSWKDLVPTSQEPYPSDHLQDMRNIFFTVPTFEYIREKRKTNEMKDLMEKMRMGKVQISSPDLQKLTNLLGESEAAKELEEKGITVTAETKKHPEFDIEIVREKETVKKYFGNQVKIFHERWAGQHVGVDHWLNSSKPYLIAYEDVKATEPYGWFHREYAQRQLEMHNMEICDPNFFDRGMNKVVCFRHLRQQQVIPVVIPDAWLIHHPAPHKYRSQKYTKSLAGIYGTSVCLGIVSSFPGKVPWLGNICGKKRSDNSAASPLVVRRAKAKGMQQTQQEQLSTTAIINLRKQQMAKYESVQRHNDNLKVKGVASETAIAMDKSKARKNAGPVTQFPNAAMSRVGVGQPLDGSQAGQQPYHSFVERQRKRLAQKYEARHGNTGRKLLEVPRMADDKLAMRKELQRSQQHLGKEGRQVSKVIQERIEAWREKWKGDFSGNQRGVVMGNTNHYASGQWRALSADGTAVQAEEIGWLGKTPLYKRWALEWRKMDSTANLIESTGWKVFVDHNCSVYSGETPNGQICEDKDDILIDMGQFYKPSLISIKDAPKEYVDVISMNDERMIRAVLGALRILLLELHSVVPHVYGIHRGIVDITESPLIIKLFMASSEVAHCMQEECGMGDKKLLSPQPHLPFSKEREPVDHVLQYTTDTACKSVRVSTHMKAVKAIVDYLFEYGVVIRFKGVKAK